MPDSRAAVLKVQWPHRESEHEAAALRAWDGNGAVRLLDEDPARHALLIERCRPGSRLGDAGAATTLAAMTDLLPRLWIPAGTPFDPLEVEAARWIEELPVLWEGAKQPFERQLLDAAVDALATLSTTQHESVLLHQDLHAYNVLSAERQPWLAIDPKPLVGAREFAVGAIVRDYTLGHGRDHVIGRLDRLCGALNLDRERARGWALGQTLAWAFDGEEPLGKHVETARWLFEAAG